MKVLQINAVYKYGSTGTIVSNIHDMLTENGEESYVAYSMALSGTAIPAEFYRIGSLSGRKIHALLSRISGKQAYFSHFSTLLLLSYIRKINPDIVHLHNLHNNYINLKLLISFLKKRSISTVITLHDCWYYTGGCYHYSFIKCRKWETSCHNCPKRFQDTPAYIFDSSKQIQNDRKKLFCGMDHLTLVGVSDWMAKETQKSLLGDKHIVVIRNGVDTSFFSHTESDIRQKYGLLDRFTVLGFANKWLSSENEKLFEAMKGFVKNNDISVMMVGCTKEQIGSLPENWIGLPYIDNAEELRDIYSSCDLFVNCTHEESLSMVNLEAQSCGTPVVTFSTTGAKETVDQISGFAVDEDDIDELFSKILTIRSNGRRHFSEKCRDFVCRYYDKRKNYERYLELYREMMANENKA